MTCAICDQKYETTRWEWLILISVQRGLAVVLFSFLRWQSCCLNSVSLLTESAKLNWPKSAVVRKDTPQGTNLQTEHMYYLVISWQSFPNISKYLSNINEAKQWKSTKFYDHDGFIPIWTVIVSCVICSFWDNLSLSTTTTLEQQSTLKVICNPSRLIKYKKKIDLQCQSLLTCIIQQLL